MKPVDSIKTGLRKYASFSGRSTPSELWWLIVALAVAEVAIVLLFQASGLSQVAIVQIGSISVSALFALTCLLLAIPFFSVSWRRLHDICWPGWLILIWAVLVFYFVRMMFMVAEDIRLCRETDATKCFGEIAWGFGFAPLMMLIFLIGGFAIIMSLPSQSEANKYGPKPPEMA